MKIIRLLAIIEANTITGPAKNLLSFAGMARSGEIDPPIEVSIAVFTRPGSSELFIERARQASVPVYTIPETSRFDRSVLKRMNSLARELRPDIIQSHAVKSHLLVRLSKLNTLAPWIAFHHGYTWTDLKMRLYNQLDRWSLRAADRLVTVSLPFREQLIRNGVNPARIEVVHNAIRPNWASEYRTLAARATLRAQLGIPSEHRVVLIVGRLSLEKDHQTLLEAMHRLATPAHLVIVGEGPERTRIKQTIHHLNLVQSVTLIGQVPSAEPYYGIADVSVLSSRSEGSPNALLESMAARVPAIATAVGGVPEIVTHNKTALLIPTGDADAMATAIASLLKDESLARRLSEAAYQTVITRFTPEARVKRLIGIYRSVLDSHKS